MAIYLTGDTHGTIDLNKVFDWDEGYGLTRDDILIILGDFGLIWANTFTEKYFLDKINDLPWTTMFIDGNHENHVMINELEETTKFGAKLHVVRDNVFHLMRGQVAHLPIDKDKTVDCAIMGGAESIDRAWRTENISWWPQEIPSEEERAQLEQALEENNWKVDYILTHDAPAELIPKLDMLVHLGGSCKANEFERWLGGIEYRTDYKHWYFGHWHIDAEVSPLHTVLYNTFTKLD